MKTMAWIGGALVVLLGITIVGSCNMSPELSAWHDQKSRIESFCDQQMEDSALGRERRQTRAVCEEMRRLHESKRPTSATTAAYRPPPVGVSTPPPSDLSHRPAASQTTPSYKRERPKGWPEVPASLSSPPNE